MKSFKSFSTALLITLSLPSLLLAWGSMGNGSANNTTLSIMSASGAGSASSKVTSFNYDSKVSSIPKTQQTVPPAFQAILNSINVSANPGIPSATVKQGLDDALTFNNKLLEGNEYKPQLIAPLTSILLSSTYDTSIKTLALQNLESIAKNDKIDVSYKLDMIDPLFTFAEQSIKDSSWTQDNLFLVEYSFKSIIDDKNTPQEKNDYIANRLFAENSPLWTNAAGFNCIFSTLESYLRTENSDLSTKKPIIDYFLNTISELNQDSKVTTTEEIILTLGCAFQDSRLDSPTKTNIANAVQNVFTQVSNPAYQVKRACLGVLMVAKDDTAIDESTRSSIKNTIVQQGVTAQNKAIWDKYGVLLLIEPDVSAQVNDAVLQRIDNSLATIPQGSRPLTISIQDTINDSKNTQTENQNNTGSYENSTHVIFIKVNELNTYEADTFHETGHFVQQEKMTLEQEQRWDALWEQSNGIEDFAKLYGANNKGEDRSTVMEYVFLDSLLADEKDRLLPRAQAQAQAGDTTLLNKINLAKEIWGVS